MNSSHVFAIKEIYGAALKQVHAGQATPRNLRRVNVSTLDIAGNRVAVDPGGVYMIAFGKAALGMSIAAASVLGDLLAAGVAVTKDERGEPPERVRLLRGSHPVPDERSIAAGEAILEFARAIPKGSTVLCLLSGGGSALVEAPRNGVTLVELRRVTRHLLSAGATIQELNAVRSGLSRIKAGGLLRELKHAQVHNLIVSDVLGDDLQSIGSGPTVPPDRTIDPHDVLTAYGLELDLPQLDEWIGTAAPSTAIIANVGMAIDAAVQRASEIGLTPFVLSRSLEGEARELGRMMASVTFDSEFGRTSFHPGACLIAGGETVVTLRGDGTGGRNTEAALAAALHLARNGSRTSTVAFLATDGDDGVSGVAGAIIDGQTVSDADSSRARAALSNNDSFTFLQQIGAAFSTGPSGTNVNDLVIAIVGG